MANLEETEKKIKETTSGIKSFLWVVFIIGIIIVTIRYCAGCGDKKEVNKVKETEEVKDIQKESVNTQQEKLKKDSAEIVKYIYDNSELSNFKDIRVEVLDLDEKTCRIQTVIPEEMSLNADVVGKGMCMLATKWASGKGCDLSKMSIRCLVVSPFKGVTAREGMVIWWGTAKYDYQTDNLKWEWNKDK